MHSSGASRRGIIRMCRDRHCGRARHTLNRHRPRRRAIQYSETPIMESRSCDVLDTPLSRSMTVFARSGATKQSILSLRGEMDCFAEPVNGRAFARPLARNDGIRTSAAHSQPSSPAKAGDPVFRDANNGIEKLRCTGYSAFAEYDGLCEERSDEAIHSFFVPTRCGSQTRFHHRRLALTSGKLAQQMLS